MRAGGVAGLSSRLAMEPRRVRRRRRDVGRVGHGTAPDAAALLCAYLEGVAVVDSRWVDGGRRWRGERRTAGMGAEVCAIVGVVEGGCAIDRTARGKVHRVKIGPCGRLE